MLPRDCEMNDELWYFRHYFPVHLSAFIKILSALKLHVPLDRCGVWVLGVALLVAVCAHSTLSHNHRRHWQKWWDFDFSVNVSTYLGFLYLRQHSNFVMEYGAVLAEFLRLPVWLTAVFGELRKKFWLRKRSWIIVYLFSRIRRQILTDWMRQR